MNLYLLGGENREQRYCSRFKDQPATNVHTADLVDTPVKCNASFIDGAVLPISMLISELDADTYLGAECTSEAAAVNTAAMECRILKRV